MTAVAERFRVLARDKMPVRVVAPRTVHIDAPLARVQAKVDAASHILRQRPWVVRATDDEVDILLVSRQHVAYVVYADRVVCPACEAQEEARGGVLEGQRRSLMEHEMDGFVRVCFRCGIDL